MVQGIKHPLSNKVFIGLERKMKSFNLLSNKVLIGSVVQGMQLDLSNKVLIGSRSRFAHAAQNRIFILLCKEVMLFARAWMHWNGFYYACMSNNMSVTCTIMRKLYSCQQAARHVMSFLYKVNSVNEDDFKSIF